MLALAGCVQPGLSPNTNAATARLLDKLGITLFEAPEAGFVAARCASISMRMRRRWLTCATNIDAWWPHVEAGVEAIVMTASGWEPTPSEYGVLMKGDRPMPRRPNAFRR